MHIKHAKHIIDQTIDAVSQWSDLGKEHGIPLETIKQIESTLQLTI